MWFLLYWTIRSTLGESSLDCQVHFSYHTVMANANAPATAKGRAMRERIVHAAAELIAAKGVTGMSLADVRSRTGASRSQLYHYFENRDDLVHAVIDVSIHAVLNTKHEHVHHP